jgi:hypothetical protein
MTESLPTTMSEEDNNGWSVTKIAVASILGFVGVLVIIFIVALILALADVERAGQIVQLLRDFLVITITLEGVLIGFAFIVLVIQIARLVNLFQSEARPILENTQDATASAKGTAQFVKQNATEPLVRALSFWAGLRVFVRELGGIRRAVRREKSGAEGNDNAK